MRRAVEHELRTERADQQLRSGVLNGWGVRPSDWTLDVSIQRQILPRASATLAYSRRWFHGFTVADNLALQPSDLTPFSVVAPVDPRLPGGGGYVVSGLRCRA